MRCKPRHPILSTSHIDTASADTPSDDDVLTWEAATELWRPKAVAAGGLDLANRGDLHTAGAGGVDVALPIGPAHSVLWSDGVDASWQTAPEVQYLKDTAGNTRVTLSTGIFGGVRIDGGLAIGANPSPLWPLYLFLTGTLTLPSFFGIRVNSTNFIMTSTSAYARVIDGSPSVMFDSAGTNLRFRGMNFSPIATQGPTYASQTFIEIIGMGTRPQMHSWGGATMNAQLLAGALIESPTIGTVGTTVIVTSAGMDIQNYGHATVATAYGLRIADQSGATLNYIIEAGPATPNLRVEGGAPAANVSQALIAVNNGAVVLRRIEIGAANGESAGYRTLRCLN